MYKRQVYAKRSSNDRLSDPVKRAGGVTSKAYVKGARLLRRMNSDELDRVKSAMQLAKHSKRDSVVIDSMVFEQVYYVGIDLKEALENPGGESDLVLREGDILQVSNYVNTVKISGAVMYPCLLYTSALQPHLLQHCKCQNLPLLMYSRQHAMYINLRAL